MCLKEGTFAVIIELSVLDDKESFLLVRLGKPVPVVVKTTYTWFLQFIVEIIKNSDELVGRGHPDANILSTGTLSVLASSLGRSHVVWRVAWLLGTAWKTRHG